MNSTDRSTENCQTFEFLFKVTRQYNVTPVDGM